MKERSKPVEPTDAVIRAVAIVNDVDPVELDVPLFESVDPDALDRLFESPAEALSTTFHYHGHDVAVQTDMTVVVDGTPIEPARNPSNE